MLNQFSPMNPELWSIMNAGHIGFPKILEEFIDNSISGEADHILIRLEQKTPDAFILEVGDNGCGISESQLSQAFGVGHAPSTRQAGVYNQYGIGLKSALASCDPENHSWHLYSSTDGQTCVKVVAPYCSERMSYDIVPWCMSPAPSDWPHGTWVTTPVGRTLFQTCKFRSVDDSERIEALVEELRVTYAPLLADHDVILNWKPLQGKEKCYQLAPLLPAWVDGSVVGKEERANFGRGDLTIRYSFGRITPNKQGVRYFKGNLTSSGLMIYINGRLVQHNLFEVVWTQPHPNHNRFLFVVDLRTKDGNRDALPIPRPDKDQMIFGDDRFDALAKWVRKRCPDPRKILAQSQEKEELVKCRAMAKALDQSGKADYVQLELPMEVKNGRTTNRADLYVRMKDGRAVLYEAKKDASKVQDVSQLATYYLLATGNGLQLDELVLVAKRHNSEVHEFTKQLSDRWFRDLPVPVIRCLTWEQVDNGVF